jgi:hypothetical protein
MFSSADRLWWDAFDLRVRGERRHWSEDDAFMIAETWIIRSVTG